MKVATDIRIVPMHGVQWGLVSVHDADASVVRSWRISADEFLAVQAGESLPPGCSRSEWESGSISVGARPCLPGDAVVNEDGTLVHNFGIVEDRQTVKVSLLRVPAGQWEIRGSTVFIERAALRLTKAS